MRVCVCVGVYVYIYICVYIFVYTYVLFYMYMCIHIYIYLCIEMGADRVLPARGRSKCFCRVVREFSCPVLLVGGVP